MARDSRPPSARSSAEVWNTPAAWGAVLAVVVVVLATAVWPLLSGQAEPVWDALGVHYPSFIYQIDALAEGRLPLWDPYTNCGYPFHADPNNATLNPVAAVSGMLLGGTLAGFICFWVFFWLLAAIGMFAWARSWGATPPGAGVAAVCYALSGFFIGHGQHTVFILVGAGLPLAFWAAEQAVARASLGHALIGGSIFGLTALGGYPPMSFFGGFSLALWLVLQKLAGRTGSLRWIAITLSVVAAVLVVSTAPQLYAFFAEGRGYTDRTDALSYEFANFDNVFSLPSFYSLLYPYATIVSASALETDVSMANGYAGALAIPLLAIWMLDQRAQGRRVWWLVAFLAITFLTSLGGQALLRIVFYYLLPPMRFMRHSGALRLFWILPLTLGAGLGLSALFNSARARQLGWRVFLVWAAIAAVAALLLGGFLRNHELGASETRLYGVTTVVVIVAITTSLILRLTHERWRGLLIAALAATVGVEMGLHVRINEMTLWQPAQMSREIEAQHVRETRLPGEPGARLEPLAFGWFNWQQIVKRPLVMGYTAMKTRAFEGALTESRFKTVMQLPARAWMSPGGEVAGSPEQALQVLMQTASGDPIPTFVEAPLERKAERRVQPGEYGAVTVTSYAPERIAMRVQVSDSQPALLVTTERYAPSWRAFIDGTPAKVSRVNLLFRGLWIPPGSHEVVWKYQPTGFLLLVPLAMAALFGSFTAGVMLVQRKRLVASKMLSGVRAALAAAAVAAVAASVYLVANPVRPLASESASSSATRGVVAQSVGTPVDAPAPGSQRALSNASWVSDLMMDDVEHAAQLLRGFFPNEDGSWRWTEKQFAVVLATPQGTSEAGATMRLEAAAVEPMLRMGPVTITASVEQHAVGTATLVEVGSQALEFRVAARLLSKPVIEVVFDVDKTFRAPPDERDLGIMVSRVALLDPS